MQENDKILDDWETQKTECHEKKQKIQNMLLSIQSAKKKDIIQL